MTNNHYGGRYTTNYIEDIKPPVKHVAVQEDRSGLTNFRPFEEIAHNIPLARHIPRALHKKLWVDYSASISPVSVQVFRSPVLAGYTYVPPLTTRNFDWHGRSDAHYETFVGALSGVARISIDMFKTFGEWVGEHITVPVMTGASTVSSLLFGTSYTVDQGVQRRWKTGVRAYALASLLALFVIVGAFLLLNHLLGQSAQPTTRTATSSAHVEQQSASNSTTSSTRPSSAPHTQLPATPSTASPSTPNPTAAAGSSILNNGTASVTGGSLPAVGGYGGGSVSPSTASGMTTPTTSTNTSPLPNPAAVIPYTTVTTPPLSISSGDKQAFGTSGATFTTN